MLMSRLPRPKLIIKILFTFQHKSFNNPAVCSHKRWFFSSIRNKVFALKQKHSEHIFSTFCILHRVRFDLSLLVDELFLEYGVYVLNTAIISEIGGRARFVYKSMWGIPLQYRVPSNKKIIMNHDSCGKFIDKFLLTSLGTN